MAFFRKKEKPPRQQWHPHWIVRLIRWAWMTAFGAFKVAIGALCTVLIIIGICFVVLAGSLGDYMEEEILGNLSTDRDESGGNLNSYVYYLDEHGQIQKLQNIFAVNNREWADFEDIPKNLINATVAIEDKRFYEHQGVDWVTTVKACFFMFFGNGDRGGSTITQQLVKNVTDNWDVTVQRKVQEIFTAIEYERRYSKNEILEWYLNEIYMGNRINGVKMAAARYFGKELQSLTVAECASLISITNNPSLYNPYRTNPDVGGMTGAQRNKERQLDTLREMWTQGWISYGEYIDAVAQPLDFKSGIADEDRWTKCLNAECGYQGIAASFTGSGESGTKNCPVCGTPVPVLEDASLSVYSYYVDTLIEDVARDLAAKDGVALNDSGMSFYKSKIASGGYHIYACLDMQVQNAVDSIYQDLEEIPQVRSGQQPQSAIVVIDNRTGDIVAICGGVGTEKAHDGQNRAVDSKLQTGSSIKPLSVYGPAFESGAITPATVVRDMPQKYTGSGSWPKNDNRKYGYTSTVYSAVMRSVNACAVSTLELSGVGYAYAFAKNKLMMTSLLDTYTASSGQEMSDEDFAPLALGAQTLGLTVREMANAFATFPNNGFYREGRTYTKVYDSNGEIVLDNEQQTHEVFSEKTVNYMHYCLAGSVAGTGGNARISGQNVYGKTGTTASNKDRWFCGYTNYYTAAVWFGFDTPEVINLVRSGTNPAAILFSKVLTKVHTGLDKVQLIDSKKLTTINVCLDSGMIATEACEMDVRADLKRVDEAKIDREDKELHKEKCTKHVQVEWCNEGAGVANEYCKLFADAYAQQEGYDPTKPLVTQQSLVKMTRVEADEIFKAKKYGILPEYLLNSYVWMINEDGTDAVWTGFDGKMKQGKDAPYCICHVHDAEAWEAYQQSQIPEETVPGETIPGETVPGETNPDDGAVG